MNGDNMALVTHEDIRRVLDRLQIPAGDRLDATDQDAEYTACRSDELDRYLDLYRTHDLDDRERSVLCCFILESLNELVQDDDPHPRQQEAFRMLFSDERLHRDELRYWADRSEPDPDHWWPITAHLVQFQLQQYGCVATDPDDLGSGTGRQSQSPSEPGS